MISIDDHAPSDPSSSHHQHQHHHLHNHHQQHNSHDLKVSDIDLKSTDADLDDTNNQLPNFSIRDYVFSLRSKDIACNWPFSSTSLQLCLKHGVKNLLPPFQTLDCLRNNSSLTGCSVKNRLTDEELVTSFDGKPRDNQFKSNKKIVISNSSSSKEGKESKFILQGQSGQTKSKEKQPAASQKSENASVSMITKKSRFVIKMNSGVEHIAPNSETMASKVCPVCKTFSSSSNTTLNAHIDQCLTGEATMKWTDNPKVIVKHKVKPRKMRLMVDIYKTAPHCTVEELDRRNGTSWATKSNFPAQEIQFHGEEEEKEEPKLTKVNPDNEGDVYIDTNGTKVRILSAPKTGSSDVHKGRKLTKGLKGSKLIMGKKNNHFKKKHHKKYLKLTCNARKLCSPKSKVKSCQGEEVVMAENLSKVECNKEVMKVVDLGVSRPPWACSKRTGLSKKPDSKNQKGGLKCYKLKDLVVKNSVKSSLSVVKQPLNRLAEFRKEATLRHHNDDEDDDDGSLDACPSQHSDDDDDDLDDDDDDDYDYDYEGTPDADIRSKGCKFSTLSKKLSFPVTKFNLKRKFSAVEKSCAKSVDEPSQDSSKEHSRIEEHITNNKKQETRSVTSKSSIEESSVGFQTLNGNELEYVKSGTLLSIQAPSFMGLSTSFDPEFSNQECMELYQDQICSTNRAPNDVEKQENYFQEIDPIPIPGPPGSFLPASPGGEMVSEEHIQETAIYSSENQHHHDTMDQDSMSNSPVSTVSNSRSSCGKDDRYIRPYFNSNPGFTETGQSQSYLKNDQPCCCSRKEVALNYQDPYTLRKQSTESKNFKSEMLSVRNHPKSSVIASTTSPSKPVLRLMGKNLTVETDEDDSRPTQSSQYHPQRPVIFGQYQNGIESHHFNVHPSGSPVDLKPFHHGFSCYDSGGLYPGTSRPHYVHNVVDSKTIAGKSGYYVGSSSRPVKEIVMVDDSPENEEDDNTTMQNSFFKGNQGQMNPLYTMYPPFVGGGGHSGGRFRAPSSNGNIAGKWNMGSSTAYHHPSHP
ncbi:hypothetical protein R6Q59_018644 [Mikania micrantha]